MFKHGVYAQIGDEVLNNSVGAGAAVLYVGMSPLHLSTLPMSEMSEYVNVPLRISSMKDANRYLGYSDNGSDWSTYNLCQVVSRHFLSGNYNISPIYVINVFDPSTMRGEDVTDETRFTNRVMRIPSDKVILQSVAIAGYASGVHYKVSYTTVNGIPGVTIRDITENGIPKGTKLTYYTVDPDAVGPSEIIGTTGDENERATGLYAIKYLYPNHNVYPMWFCCPQWSTFPDVVRNMHSAAMGVNGHWNALTVSDLPLETKAFEDFTCEQYVTSGNNFKINLTNNYINGADIKETLIYSKENAGDDYVVADKLSAGTVAEVSTSTYAKGTYNETDYVVANEVGSPLTLGYHLAFKVLYTDSKYRFVLYKLPANQGPFTDADIYWDSGTCDDKAAVVAKYAAAVDSGDIDDIITITEAEWPESTISTTYFTDGVNAGSNLTIINSSFTGFAKVVLTAKNKAVDTREQITGFMQSNPAWANEYDKPCWPLAVYEGHIYNISTLYCAEALSLCTRNNGVPYETPSNRPAPVSSLFFAGKDTAPYDIEGANELNQYGICTCLQWGGWRLWGNSTGAYSYGGSYPMRARFDTNQVMQLFLCNDFQVFLGDLIDRPMTTAAIQTILTDYQHRLDSFGMLGAEIRFIREDNPASELMEGNFVFQLPNTPTPPLNSATVTVIFTDEGYENYFDEEGYFIG